ncbi:response regulator [Flammeovirgaceae bacterium SG7u.111]|nr:response regulator [Flammeovirgaceae bacterium SG7u.132]WPO35346.1 response regulator [Flammeovirgaceae bacterium SG7u.111]
MKKYQILIADDQQETIRVLVQLISSFSAQYKVLSANSGEIAFRLASERKPDLIILDWCMPDLDGIETLTKLKKQSITKDIPVIILTGKKTEDEDLEYALSAGAVDYIKKPINKVEFKARINSAIRLAESYKTVMRQQKELAQLNDQLKEQVEVKTKDLQESTELYMLLAENYPNGIVSVLTGEFVYEFVSGKELDELGLGHEEFLGNKVTDIFDKTNSGIIVKEYEKVKQGESTTFEIMYKGNNYLMSASPISNEEGEINRIFSVSQNITPQKETEKQLKENKRFIEKAMKASPSVLYILDLESQKPTYISKNSERLLGFTPSELMKKSGKKLLELVHPEDREMFCEFLVKRGKSFDDVVDELEYRVQHKEGNWIWILAKETVFTQNNEGHPLLTIGTISDITENKERHEKEIQLLHKKEMLNKALQDREVRLEESLNNLMLVNEKLARNEAQLKAQNAELKKINSELDNFVYRAAHDLRSPVTTVLGLLELNRNETDIDKIRHYSRLQEQSLRKLDRFISYIVNISKNARVEIASQEINFKAFLEIILKQLLPPSKNIIINQEIEVIQESPFYSDQRRLYDIFSNLIANSIQYRNPYTTEPFIKVKVNVNENVASIEVSDNGVGISEEHVNRVFEMFYRGNENSTGSGLGLYIVKETVNRLQGELSVESLPGSGTRFSIEIPNLKDNVPA